MRLRKTVVALFLALGTLGVLPVLAAAATSYTDSISGVEVFATATEGVFVGLASGPLPGAWSADVFHGPLPSSVGLSGAITGGSFSLATVLNKHFTLVSGSFDTTGGTIRLRDQARGCGIQHYVVADALTNVGVGPAPTGNGSFAALLTHYRAKIFGSCITYAATVAGSVSLTF
jgi:hypothetical protein